MTNNTEKEPILPRLTPEQFKAMDKAYTKWANSPRIYGEPIPDFTAEKNPPKQKPDDRYLRGWQPERKKVADNNERLRNIVDSLEVLNKELKFIKMQRRTNTVLIAVSTGTLFYVVMNMV